MQSTRIIAVALLLSAAPAAAEEVSGCVFIDANRNGRRDRGEPPACGVGVTDGVGFARTGADGRYTIHAKVHELLRPNERPIVSVSFPSGTWPVGPWFRRLYRRKDAHRVDFPLRRIERKLPLVFVHATDPHVPRCDRKRFGEFRGEIRQLAGRAALCVLTGDCVNMADIQSLPRAKAQWDLFAELVKGFPLPLFAVPGNHDPAGVNCIAGWRRKHPMYGYGFYWKVVGPLRWSFNCAGVHFVGIDFLHKTGPKWVWGVPASAIEWLRQDLELLKPPARVLLFVHDVQGLKAHADLLRSRGVEHIFCGHTHTVSTGEVAGIGFARGGSLGWVFPHKLRRPQVGYRLVRVEPGGIETFYKPLGAAVAVTVDFPRSGGVIRPGQLVRGRFFDPRRRIRAVTVRLAGAAAKATIRRGEVFSLFEARVDLAKVKPGLRKLVAAASDGRTTWQSHVRCFVGFGKKPPPNAAADGPAK